MPRCTYRGQRIIFRTLVSPSTVGAGDQTQATKFATEFAFTRRAVSPAFNVLLSFFFKGIFMHMCVLV